MNVDRAKDLGEHLKQIIETIYQDKEGSLAISGEIEEFVEAAIAMITLRQFAQK